MIRSALPAAAVADGDGVGVEEPGRPDSFDQLDAGGGHVLAEALLVVGVVGCAAGVGQRGCQVELWGWSAQSEGGPGSGVTHQPGGTGEGPDRRRTPVEAGPPEPVGLDQGDLGVELACLQGRVQAGRPATKDQ